MRKSGFPFYALPLLPLLIFSCKHAPTSPEPGIDQAHPRVRMVNFTQARISDNRAVTRSTQDLDKIGFGIVSGPTYQEQIKITPVIFKDRASYTVQFDTLINIPDSALSVTVRIRFYFFSGGPLDVDTVLIPYKYPYSSTEVVLPYSNVPWTGARIQDIAFAKDTMYLLFVGDDKLFQLPLGQTSVQFYYQIQESDFLAGDSCYILIDNGMNLDRFNVNAKSIDLTLRPIPGGSLRGIAAELGRVYVLYPEYIMVFNRSGNSIDSINVMPGNVFHCAVFNEILYMSNYSSQTIDRFNTGTLVHSFLSALRAPARNIEGMEIYQGFLYYGDFTKGSIMRMPLSDLVLTE